MLSRFLVVYSTLLMANLNVSHSPRTPSSARVLPRPCRDSRSLLCNDEVSGPSTVLGNGEDCRTANQYNDSEPGRQYIRPHP
ncbi:hypothetical protein C8Q74DRAFT_261900 [Fomes fomentarius]|nr:hypothetical protein C8Q74DRAFT_261900 [Fomes fomentarius]